MTVHGYKRKGYLHSCSTTATNSLPATAVPNCGAPAPVASALAFPQSPHLACTRLLSHSVAMLQSQRSPARVHDHIFVVTCQTPLACHAVSVWHLPPALLAPHTHSLRISGRNSLGTPPSRNTSHITGSSSNGYDGSTSSMQCLQPPLGGYSINTNTLECVCLSAHRPRVTRFQSEAVIHTVPHCRPC